MPVSRPNGYSDAGFQRSKFLDRGEKEVDSFKHNVPTLNGGQANFKQCWLASYGMLQRFHSKPTADFETRLAGAGIDVSDAKQNGLVDTQFAKASSAAGTTIFSSKPFKDTSFWDFDVSSGAKEFIKELKNGPLWVSRFISEGTYHIVLATGYNDSGTGYIIFNNPFPGPDNAVEVNNITATVFCRFITDARGSVQGYR